MDEKERRRQTREAWHRARDEMREAFHHAWREGKFPNDPQKWEGFEEFVQNLTILAKGFGREVGQEASRFGREFADDAREQATEAWKGVRKEWRDRQREHSHQHGGRHEHWLFAGRRFQHWAEGDEEANPLLAAMMSRGGGLLSLYLLHLLAEQPRHGNDLMKEIERRTMGGWTSNPGAVYPLLSEMESKGLVISNWEEPDKRTRRIYRITEEGQGELASLKQMFRPKLMDTIEALHDIYDDLYGGSSSEGPIEEEDAPESAAPPQEGEGGGGEQQPIEASSSNSEGSIANLVRAGTRVLLDKVLGPGSSQVSQPGNPTQ